LGAGEHPACCSDVMRLDSSSIPLPKIHCRSGRCCQCKLDFRGALALQPNLGGFRLFHWNNGSSAFSSTAPIPSRCQPRCHVNISHSEFLWKSVAVLLSHSSQKNILTAYREISRKSLPARRNETVATKQPDRMRSAIDSQPACGVFQGF
jgi:hypothetical protein